MSDDSEDALLKLATAGDHAALERLLLAYYDRLHSRVARKIPADLQSKLAADDILQDAFVEVFRCIGDFHPQGRDAFYHWLATITERRLLDAFKVLRAAKRGGGRRAVDAAERENDSSVVSLLEMVNVTEHTPSRSAAGHEAAAAVRVALAGLREDYRTALTMRYIDGLAVSEVAGRMNRTDRAVHMLCYRGLEALRAAMGRSSAYLSRK